MKFNAASVAAMLCAMQNKKVLVLGDVMLDRFIDGVVNRISPEAPVPILSQSRVYQMAGGAANVACNLAQLGLHVHLIGVCGNDTTATDLETEISAYPAIQFDPVRIKGRQTTLKTRYRSGGQQILRVDDEITLDIDDRDAKRALTLATAALDEADLMVISDYGKGALPLLLLRQIIATARAKGKHIIADPKQRDVSAYANVDVLTPNLKELTAITAMRLGNFDEVGEASTTLARTHGIGSILTTLSARGILLSLSDGTQFHDPASAREIFDVAGAGDTVVAMVAAALAVGSSLEGAVRLANHAAGVAVGKSGTAIVAPGELLAHVGSTPPITDWPHIATQCASWRDAGQKVAFANGCFDLLHPGHIHLLTEASKTADKLVIGLNSDASVNRLKGNGRPKQPSEIRSAILAALPIVDAVAVFDQDNPSELIATLKPDFLVKGDEYAKQTVVGADIVTAWGGKVVLIPMLEGHSTSDLASS